MVDYGLGVLGYGVWDMGCGFCAVGFGGIIYYCALVFGSCGLLGMGYEL